MEHTIVSDTRILVDLDRIAGNMRAVRDMAGPGVAVAAVVKADAYGHGAVAVAPTLMENGAAMLAVANLKEALALTNKAVTEALDGLPPQKIHCSVLAEEAIKSALANYYKGQGIDPTPIIGCTGNCQNCHGHEGE